MVLSMFLQRLVDIVCDGTNHQSQTLISELDSNPTKGARLSFIMVSDILGDNEKFFSHYIIAMELKSHVKRCVIFSTKGTS